MNTPSIPAPEPAAGDAGTPGPSAATVSTARPPKCPARTRQYRGGVVVGEGFPPEEISERLAADSDSVMWLDLFDPDEADLQILVEEFGLHPLAVEDAVHDHAVGVDLDAPDDILTTSELSAFITDRALITVRKSQFDID